MWRTSVAWVMRNVLEWQKIEKNAVSWQPTFLFEDGTRIDSEWNMSHIIHALSQMLPYWDSVDCSVLFNFPWTRTSVKIQSCLNATSGGAGKHLCIRVELCNIPTCFLTMSPMSITFFIYVITIGNLSSLSCFFFLWASVSNSCFFIPSILCSCCSTNWLLYPLYLKGPSNSCLPLW